MVDYSTASMRPSPQLVSLEEHRPARAIYVASDQYGQLTGDRLAVVGLCWDDVAYTAARYRRRSEAEIDAYDALDDTEKQYRTEREQWVASLLVDEAATPGRLQLIHQVYELRADQSPSDAQLIAFDVTRARRFEIEYNRLHGRGSARWERSYTVDDAEFDEGCAISWYTVDFADRMQHDGEESNDTRARALLARAAQRDQDRAPEHAIFDSKLTGAGLTRDDVVRVAATDRVESLLTRLPGLRAAEVLDLAIAARRAQSMFDRDESEYAVTETRLRALQVEATERAKAQPHRKTEALLTEFIGHARCETYLTFYDNAGDYADTIRQHEQHEGTSRPLTGPREAFERASRTLGDGSSNREPASRPDRAQTPPSRLPVPPSELSIHTHNAANPPHHPNNQQGRHR